MIEAINTIAAPSASVQPAVRGKVATHWSSVRYMVSAPLPSWLDEYHRFVRASNARNASLEKTSMTPVTTANTSPASRIHLRLSTIQATTAGVALLPSAESTAATSTLASST